MNLHKFAKKIYQINVNASKGFGAEWSQNSPITSTWGDSDVERYFNRLPTFDLDETTWWDVWKDERNKYLDRFGLVTPEIEVFILERTLKEYFEDEICANSKKNSLPNSP